MSWNEKYNLFLLIHIIKHRREPIERQADDSEIVSVDSLHECATDALDTVPARLVPVLQNWIKPGPGALLIL